jgi:hypothetical protein
MNLEKLDIFHGEEGGGPQGSVHILGIFCKISKTEENI